MTSFCFFTHCFYFKLFNFILFCLRHPFVEGPAHHNPPWAIITSHGVMMVLEYPSNGGRQVRWGTLGSTGGLPLHLAWTCGPISWGVISYPQAPLFMVPCTSLTPTPAPTLLLQPLIPLPQPLPPGAALGPSPV